MGLDHLRCPIFYSIVVVTSSALAASLVVGFLSSVQSPALTSVSIAAAAISMIAIVARTLFVSWKVIGGRLEIHGVLINRSIGVHEIRSISMTRNLLPVSVGCWGVDLIDGRRRRVPSTMRLGDQATQREGDALRVALGLPKDATF